MPQIKILNHKSVEAFLNSSSFRSVVLFSNLSDLFVTYFRLLQKRSRDQCGNRICYASSKTRICYASSKTN